MAEDYFSSVGSIPRVILLLLIGSLVGRCVGSVSVQSRKMLTPQTVLSPGEKGTLQYIKMSDVCVCIHVRVYVYSDSVQSPSVWLPHWHTA